MKKIMNVLMLSCVKATELMEKKLHFRLNSMERFQLFLHTRMCDACKSYEKQNIEMDQALRKHIFKPNGQKPISNVKLSDDFKSALRDELRKK